MNIEMIREVLMVAIGSSVFSTTLIQKLKENFVKKKLLFYVGFIVSISVGILFSLSFTNLSIINSIWVGFVTWIGADVVYKAFEDKLFASYKTIENVIELKRDDIDG